MKRPSTFGMTVRQLRELFGVGRDLRGQTQGGDPEEKRELLELWLAQSLPDKEPFPRLPEGLRPPDVGTAPRAGAAIGEILRDPSSNLRTIRRVKRRAKDWAAQALSEEEHDTAAAVYYAAIAHALVFQGQRITRFGLSSLAETYSRLRQESWVPQELVVLFDRARICCLEKAASG